MTQEDKELLLKDLCGRLPYDVFTDIEWEDGIVRNKTFINTQVISDLICDEIKFIKPYLRPMSSMTEKEDKEYNAILDNYGDDNSSDVGFNLGDDYDYLNAHHLDYRGLIEKGLALEAPEGMYEIE